jgi:hypothetical protein
MLCDVENLASSTPVSVGESNGCAAIISSAEDNPENYCKFLGGGGGHCSANCMAHIQ